MATMTGQGRRRRGRPTGAETAAREADLLAAAAELFRQKGFSATSINEVSRLTGISKTTIYSYYPDKAALFQAIASYACRVPGEAFSIVKTDAREPEEVLRDFASVISRSLKVSEAMDFLRLVIFEAPRFPRVAGAILAETRSVYAPLTTYLATLGQAGQISCDDPQVLADQFVMLVMGGYLSFLEPECDPEVARMREKRALALFLAGLGLA